MTGQAVAFPIGAVIQYYARAASMRRPIDFSCPTHIVLNRSCSSQPPTVTISATEGEELRFRPFCDGQHIAGAPVSLGSIQIFEV